MIRVYSVECDGPHGRSLPYRKEKGGDGMSRKPHTETGMHFLQLGGQQPGA